MNKRKIFNDPVYGFIAIPYDIVFDVIEHPYFQRLRRIQQLGLSSLVYPGATHAFTNPAATELGQKFKLPIAYNAAADTASWNDMKIFFDRIFK